MLTLIFLIIMILFEFSFVILVSIDIYIYMYKNIVKNIYIHSKMYEKCMMMKNKKK